MAILEKKVWVGLNPQLINHFESLGYELPKYIDKNGIVRVKRGTQILVKVEDLTDSSSIKLTKICDICAKSVKTSYHKIVKSRNNSKDGLDRCKECACRMNMDLLTLKKLEDNYVAKVNPKFAKLFWDEQDTYIYTTQSNKKTDFKCPLCENKITNKRIQDVFKFGLSCVRCSDGYSYSEKFMFELLNQLNTNFETQKSFSWANGKRYDFYIPSLNCIIETHGEQHYRDTGFNTKGGRSFVEEQENDRLKESLARKYGIEHYIIIDCRESNLEWIKNSVLNSLINNMFELKELNWLRCHEFALGSIVKTASDMWNDGLSVTMIADNLKIDRHTVVRYLKKAEILQWCKYDPYRTKHKMIIQLSLSNMYIANFESVTVAEKITGVTNISAVCNGKQKSAGGYKWMFKEDYEKQLINN